MVSQDPKRKRRGASSQSPLFEPMDLDPSRSASAMPYPGALPLRPQVVDLSGSSDGRKSETPTIKQEGPIDLTEAVNHPTTQMAHSKIGVVCDKPNAAYIELRLRYREIFLRTADKFNPYHNHAEKVAFRDVAALVNDAGIDNPRNLIYRHELGWSALMLSGEEIFTVEWDELKKHPKILKRPEQASLWYKGIFNPAKDRLHEFLRDLELLNNIILDVKEISK